MIVREFGASAEMGVSDKSLGYVLTTAAAAIFFYYSIWVLVLVSTITFEPLRVRGFMDGSSSLLL